MRYQWRLQQQSGWTLLLLFALIGAIALAWYGQTSPSVTADAPLAGEEGLEEPEQKLIALTFDDGPRRSTTTELLDGLAQRGVKATFFLIGAQVEANRDVVRRMDREGHQIGIHTYDHVKLTDLSKTDLTPRWKRPERSWWPPWTTTTFCCGPPMGCWTTA